MKFVHRVLSLRAHRLRRRPTGAIAAATLIAVALLASAGSVFSASLPSERIAGMSEYLECVLKGGEDCEQHLDDREPALANHLAAASLASAEFRIR